MTKAFIAALILAASAPLVIAQTGGVPGQPKPIKADQVAGNDGTNLRVLKTDTAGQLIVTGPTGSSANQVQGTAAVGATAVGSPVQTGGVFNTTPGTLTNGQQGAFQLDNGQLLLTKVQGMAAAGAVVVGNPISVQGTDLNQTAPTMNPLLAGVYETSSGTTRRLCGYTPVSDRTVAYAGALCHNAFALFTGAGTLWDRPWAASLANFAVSTTLTARNNIGAQLVEHASRWTVVSTPSVSTLATASIAAEASVRHVATGVCFSAASTTAPAATKLNINLRDGASGAGTIIASWTVVALAATGQNVSPQCYTIGPLVGTTNTAMTLEFSALLTNLFEDVTLMGYNVN